MKRPFLVLLALAASAGFATWLVRTPHELREILLACAGWVLGFWVAAAIQSRGPRRKPAGRAGDDEDYDEDEQEDDREEDWEDEDGEYEDDDEGDWEDDR